VISFLPSNPDFFASLNFVEATQTTEVKRRKKQRPSQAPAAPAPPQPEEAAPPSPPEPPPPADETIELDLTDEKAGALVRPRRLLTRTRYLGAATRDQLRQTGIWPLDRLKAFGPDDSVPSDHIHTYGTSTIQAGLIRRVCSECGHVSFLPTEND